MQKPVHEMDMAEIAESLVNPDPGSPNQQRIIAELARRQTIAQLEATIAQKQAAEAQERAAKWAFWAVVMAALSAFISMASVIVSLSASPASDRFDTNAAPLSIEEPVSAPVRTREARI